MGPLSCVYRDAHYVAVYKPARMLVHPSTISRDRDTAMQRVRDWLGSWVYPVHRIDRATAGIVVFARDADAAARLADQFRTRRVAKGYLAVVRGYVEPSGRIDYPVSGREPSRRAPPALTEYRRLGTVELPYPVSRYATARYSFVAAWPRTGRRHQLRRHFAHLRHPIVGDTTYGDGAQNRLFRDRLGCRRLMLLAWCLRFTHPYTGATVMLQATPDTELAAVWHRLGWRTPDDPGDDW